MQNLPLYRYLDLAGDGTGAKDTALDHSGAKTPIFIKPPAGKVYVIRSLLTSIKALTQVLPTKYGDLDALSNGISIVVERDGVEVVDLTDGEPFKANSHWGRVTFNVASSGVGTTQTFVRVFWVFEEAGEPIYLDGSQDERLVVYQHDDLSGLVSNYYHVRGYIR